MSHNDISLRLYCIKLKELVVFGKEAVFFILSFLRVYAAWQFTRFLPADSDG